MHFKNATKMWKNCEKMYFLKQFWGFVPLCFAPGSHCFAIAKFNRSAICTVHFRSIWTAPLRFSTCRNWAGSKVTAAKLEPKKIKPEEEEIRVPPSQLDFQTFFFTFFRIFFRCIFKNAFWKCASKKMWKKCVLKMQLKKMRKNVKKKFENLVGKVELWFLLLQVWFFWVPVLLQLLCCLPNFCRLKIGEEQFKSIGSGLCRSQIC